MGTRGALLWAAPPVHGRWGQTSKKLQGPLGGGLSDVEQTKAGKGGAGPKGSAFEWVMRKRLGDKVVSVGTSSGGEG